MQKKLTKIVSLAAALSITACGFAGCGSKEANVTDDQGRTKLSIGSWPTKDGPQKDSQEEKKTKFEADNPDFVIEPDNWEFDLKSFYAKAAGGQLPTVYNTHFTEIEQIASAGYGADLTAELKKQGDRKSVV